MPRNPRKTRQDRPKPRTARREHVRCGGAVVIGLTGLRLPALGRIKKGQPRSARPPRWNPLHELAIRALTSSEKRWMSSCTYRGVLAFGRNHPASDPYRNSYRRSGRRRACRSRWVALRGHGGSRSAAAAIWESKTPAAPPGVFVAESPGQPCRVGHQSSRATLRSEDLSGTSGLRERPDRLNELQLTPYMRVLLVGRLCVYTTSARSRSRISEDSPRGSLSARS